MKVTEKMIDAFEREGTGGYGDVTDVRAGLEAALAAVEVTPEMLKAYDSAWPGYPASRGGLEAVFRANV